MVCDKLPSKTLSTMHQLASLTRRDRAERAACISPDWILGEAIKGTPYRVELSCPGPAQGQFHTHPSGDPTPSGADLLGTLSRREEISCIAGATLPYKLLCLSPSPTPLGQERFSAARAELRAQQQDIDTYAKDLKGRYGAYSARTPEEMARGKELWQRLESLKGAVSREWGLMFSSCQKEL